MDATMQLADRFAEHRSRLRAVAYRMLGSLTEADDAVQETWLRLGKSDADEIENLGGWLTTVVSRVCLNMLRSRGVRREVSFGVHVPDPIVTPAGLLQPDEAASLADSVGLALLIVLDTLSPAERLAFVLHDMFDFPFDEIAALVDRSPAAARQLASRARRRVEKANVGVPDPDRGRQHRVVDAFFQATRDGDFQALIACLDPGVVLRIDAGVRLPADSMLVRGAASVAGQTLKGLSSVLARPAVELHRVLVNDGAGIVVTMGGRPVTVMGFTVSGDRITAIDSIADPARVPGIVAVPFSNS